MKYPSQSATRQKSEQLNGAIRKTLDGYRQNWYQSKTANEKIGNEF